MNEPNSLPPASGGTPPHAPAPPGLIGQALSGALGDLRYIGVALVGYNLLWALASLTVVGFAPATAALYSVAHDLAYRRPTIGWRAFLHAMYDQFWTGWRWVLLNAAALAIGASNLWFYSRSSSTVANLLSLLWLALVATWITLQCYTFPLLLEQERPSVLLATRNALALTLRYPGFTLVHSAITAVIVMLSLILLPLWGLGTVALLAFLYARAVRVLLVVERGGSLDDL